MRRGLTCIVTCALCAGCAKKAGPDDIVVGSWSGSPAFFTQMKSDPAMRAFSGMMKDAYTIRVNSDHTYELDCWAEKKGTWTLTNRLLQLEEKSSKSPLQGLMGGDPLQFGEATGSGTRRYTARLSPDKKTLSLTMGQLGEVEFHR